MRVMAAACQRNGGAMFGGGNAYLRDTDSGIIYLVDAKAVRPFEHGNRTLLDRNLPEHGRRGGDLGAVV